ncbi:MAG: hypothetical protein KGS61_00625 [Verrucomicrobia bacterium]|nr:hypothetical protein [Verrucomicrobiota bacterium]
MSKRRKPKREADIQVGREAVRKVKGSGVGGAPGLAPGAPAPAPGQPAGAEKTSIWVGSGVCGLAALFVGLGVEPVLRYHHAVTPFFWDTQSFRQCWAAPGGLLRYAADFIAQLNWNNWIGAGLTLALLGATWVVGRRLLLYLIGSDGVTPLVAVFALTAGYGRYAWPAEEIALGLLLASGAVLGWFALPGRALWARVVSFWVLATAFFWVAGPEPFVLLVLLAVGGEAGIRRRFASAAGCGLALLLMPAWMACAPAFDPLQTLHRSQGSGSLALGMAAYLVLPVGLMLSALLRRGRWCPEATGPDRRGAVSERSSVGRMPWLRWSSWVLVSGGGVALVWASWDTQLEMSIQVDRFACQREWGQALLAATRLRQFSETANLQITRALFRVGRLPEDFLKFPQQRDRDLLPDYRYGMGMCRAEAQTLLELGQVNLAAHFAHEALEFDGPRPETLELLARIYILKDQPAAARVFLNRLRLMPFHRAEADARLRALAADPKTAEDPELAMLRTRLPHTDDPSPRLPTRVVLEQALAANRQNRMAFEYLMADCLLEAQLDLLTREIPRLADFSYPAIPTLYEQALIFDQVLRWVNRLPDSQILARVRTNIRQATLDEYHRFAAVLESYHQDRAAARGALAAQFGNTWWYYVLYGQTGGQPPSPEDAWTSRFSAILGNSVRELPATDNSNAPAPTRAVAPEPASAPSR